MSMHIYTHTLVLSGYLRCQPLQYPRMTTVDCLQVPGRRRDEDWEGLTVPYCLRWGTQGLSTQPQPREGQLQRAAREARGRHQWHPCCRPPHHPASQTTNQFESVHARPQLPTVTNTCMRLSLPTYVDGNIHMHRYICMYI